MKHSQPRKNYLPSFILMLFLWVAILYIFFTIPPKSVLIIGLFLLLFFLGVFITTSLLVGNSRSGILFTIGIILMIVLKKFDRLFLINILLIATILITVNYLLKRR